MSKKENEEILEMDKRIISRRMLAGELSEKDLQAALKKLPDVRDNVEEISLEESEIK
ncbi:MAG TPA: hypothetical protein PKJ25_06770 [Smithellaceae bacterium]|jgi:hypothetical protein|nr:MAG: hypothetical protein BWY90_00224 [Deltaproteobacteria bacterium ADurb.BinA014]HNQ19121.1 hypothetical protein [Smithellaceae bacterium]HNT91747.1 hypothetical protein [Smithellaceae bacterium]HNV65204.1 hypothetical protein [Smithellaceae bacterium]HNZ31779.1 hypothetical protein [Smithellaceae bacterium]